MTTKTDLVLNGLLKACGYLSRGFFLLLSPSPASLPLVYSRHSPLSIFLSFPKNAAPIKEEPYLVFGWRDIVSLLSFGRFGDPGTLGCFISSKPDYGIPCKKHPEFSDYGMLELG